MIEFYPIDVRDASRFLRLIPPIFIEDWQVTALGYVFPKSNESWITSGAVEGFAQPWILFNHAHHLPFTPLDAYKKVYVQGDSQEASL
jgi:hypothetical protein